MQIKKDDVKERIMEAAGKEFLRYGFQKASLRDIASNAGVTKGNIYTYFRNKNELFNALAGPAMNHIKKSMYREYNQEYTLSIINNTEEAFKEYGKDFSEFIYTLFDHENGLKLLFFAAAGSKMENFREEVFELYFSQTAEFIKTLSLIIPDKEIRFSEMLIHTLASMYLRLVEEILIHEPEKDELDEYIEQMSVLLHSGFIKIIKMQL